MIELTESHLDWAAEIARMLHRNLPPAFDVEDLEQVARMAVWHCTKHFDPTRGIPFPAYAIRRVRGSVLMAVRRRNWKEAHHIPLEGNGTGGRPGNGGSKGEINRRWSVRIPGGLKDTRGSSPGKRASYEVGSNKMAQQMFPPQDAAIEESDVRGQLVRGLGGLPAAERCVLACVFLMEVPMQVLAERMEVSLSTAYTIRTRGLVMMRSEMKEVV